MGTELITLGRTIGLPRKTKRMGEFRFLNPLPADPNADISKTWLNGQMEFSCLSCDFKTTEMATLLAHDHKAAT